MINFVECCPYCEKDVSQQLRELWQERECFQREFELPCPHCDKPIQVDVRMTPEFELSVLLCLICHQAVISSGQYCDACSRLLVERWKENTKDE